MDTPLRGISSMATRRLLTELAQAWQREGGTPLALESVGGVDAARRVQAGEAFDAVFLASDALDALEAAGWLAPGSRVDLARSGVAVAVRAGAPHPDITTEAAVRRAIEEAASIAYSTGPSGTALLRLFARWGIAEAVQDRTVQAPPGVPVGELVARGEAELGFQQWSELMHLGGIDVLGPLPRAIQIETVFSGAVAASSQRADAVHALLRFMASPACTDAKKRQGMAPA
jgi:molybdate transport system substrate-binding protein